MELLFTPAAERDLDDIWYSIAIDKVGAADRMIDEIRRRSEQLAAFPDSGKSRPDIASGMRSVAIGNYLLLYRNTETAVEVVRVVYGARNLPDLF